jgi:hypothetical protein
MQYGRNFLHLDEGAALLLLALAPLQVLAGIPAAAVRFRERGYLAAAAALVGAAWLQSVGYTSAGTEVSLRVLSPAMAVLSIAASGVLVRWRAAATAAIVACLAWTVAQGSVYPGAFSSWPEAAFKSAAKPAEFQVAEQLASALPKGTHILTDNAYLHAALSDKGVDVVPVWSPEVRFLFGSQPEEADRRLAELRIDIVAYYPRSLNTRYLSGASPFYASLPQRWRSAADVEGVVVFYHR